MAQRWQFLYGEDEIAVLNTPSSEELHVNGSLQDVSTGSVSRTGACLDGALGSGERLKALLTSNSLEVRCSLYVDGELLVDGSRSGDGTHILERRGRTR
ncbi:MAG: hypothetical protein FWH11_05685 [Micrococcales bacterium]|nr:hypothetical protein [Micrococcales bacterium]